MAKQSNVVVVQSDELVIEPSPRELAERDYLQTVTGAVQKAEAGEAAIANSAAETRNYYGSVDAFEADRATVKAAVIAGFSQDKRKILDVAAALPDLRSKAGKALSEGDKASIKAQKNAAKNVDAHAEVYVSRIRDAAWPSANDTNGADDDAEDKVPMSDSDKAREKVAALVAWIQKREGFDFDQVAVTKMLQAASAKMQAIR